MSTPQSPAKILVLGSGAREDALIEALKKSAKLASKQAWIGVCPGNDAMAVSERWSESISHSSFETLSQRILREKITLVVVGPDNPLAEGIVDFLTNKNIRVFGPTQKAAKLEWSKSFAKEIMEEARVPTARHFVANTLEQARSVLETLPWSLQQGWVLKADGLALGKGVVVCRSCDEALSHLERLFLWGGKVLIEEEVLGEESSWLAFCDGNHCLLLDPARDYKRLEDQNQGPNTGGMGAFSPLPEFKKNHSFAERVRKEVFEPLLLEMRRRGTPYKGILYAGLMVSDDNKKYRVLELNSRFGDPEAQALLARLDEDLLEILEACVDGTLSRFGSYAKHSSDWAVYVVKAANGYPQDPQLNTPLQGVEEVLSWKRDVFRFAGVKKDEGIWKTAGGRVLGALGLGKSLEEARRLAYENLRHIHFNGEVFRKDIGQGV